MQNGLNAEAYGIYHSLTYKEKREMQGRIAERTLKYARALDEEVYPLMPTGKNVTIKAKRDFLGIYAERQARLQEQLEWLEKEREKHAGDENDLS